MYNVGDSVYIYLNDLTLVVSGLKALIYSRFGYITKVEEVDNGDGSITPKYHVKTRTNTDFTIDGNNAFKVCNLSELKDVVESLKGEILSQKEYDDIIAMISL